MRLNTLKPAAGSKKTNVRVGRGGGLPASARPAVAATRVRRTQGGYHKVGFEGGQMPLQRRLPKRGCRSAIARVHAECASVSSTMLGRRR